MFRQPFVSKLESSPIRREARRRLPALSVVVALAFSNATAFAVHEPLDNKAADILDKYIEVTGGRAAYERIHNRVAKKRAIHVEMGFEDTFVDYSAKPREHYVEIESDAMGAVRQGTHDQVAWYWSEQIGAMIEEGESLAAALNAAAFDRMLNWRDYFKEAKYVGIERVNGEDCHKIVLTPNAGVPETHFFAVDSNLPIKVKKTRLFSNMPSLPVEVVYSDYRRVDDILLPHRARQSSKQCGSTRVVDFVTESIEHNVDLPADRFDPPSSVQAAALLSKGSTAVKSILSGGEKKSAASPRPPCGTKSAQTSNEGSGNKRKPCGGG